MSRKEGARLAHMLKVERELHAQGIARVGGIDEAGRGPLAGPVVAAVVVFPPGARIPGVDDSKKVLPEVREELYDEILQIASGVGIGIATAEEIDEINILRATKLAMDRALKKLKFIPDYLLLDAVKLDRCTIPQRAFVKGDSKCFSIAAASIMAKVTRDRMMMQYHQEFPEYDFDQHKGYATSAHYDKILQNGLCTLHRRTFFDPGFFSPTDLRWSLRHGSFMRGIGTAAAEAELEALTQELHALKEFLPVCEVHSLSAAARVRLDQLRNSQ